MEEEEGNSAEGLEDNQEGHQNRMFSEIDNVLRCIHLFIHPYLHSSFHSSFLVKTVLVVIDLIKIDLN